MIEQEIITIIGVGLGIALIIWAAHSINKPNKEYDEFCAKLETEAMLRRYDPPPDDDPPEPSCHFDGETWVHGELDRECGDERKII